MTPEPGARSGDETRPAGRAASPIEVLAAFLKLGLTSFGGPVAHLGYFRTEFVERRRWLDDRSYTDLVALCQFLPGPASSKVGIALGLGRAGWLGALAAWAGFTLPSAVAMVLFAHGIARWQDLAGSGAIHGLKVAAVAVVAQAVWGMARSLCPDFPRAAIAIGSTLLVLAVPSAAGQVGAIVAGGLIGWRVLELGTLPPHEGRDYGVSRATGTAFLLAFGLLLALLPALAAANPSLALSAFAAFYQSGSLVFGGGHVLLPLLQASVVPPGWVGTDTFLAGYGAAQAIPGPLFTFAAFLGASMPAPLGGWAGGALLLVAIFLPAFLLIVGSLPHWQALRSRSGMQRALAGINAAVVGVLAAALYDPVLKSAVHAPADLALALAAFGLLMAGKASPVIVVAFAAAGGWALAAFA